MGNELNYNFNSLQRKRILIEMQIAMLVDLLKNHRRMQIAYTLVHCRTYLKLKICYRYLSKIPIF